jgi:hypothetical protein
MNAQIVSAKPDLIIRLDAFVHVPMSLALLLTAVGLMLFLASCIDDPGLGTSTPGSEATQPSQSPLVTPGRSQDVRSLPTAPPPRPDTPVFEINPRGHPPASATPSPEITPTPAPQQDTE